MRTITPVVCTKPYFPCIRLPCWVREKYGAGDEPINYTNRSLAIPLPVATCYSACPSSRPLHCGIPGCSDCSCYIWSPCISKDQQTSCMFLAISTEASAYMCFNFMSINNLIVIFAASRTHSNNKCEILTYTTCTSKFTSAHWGRAQAD